MPVDGSLALLKKKEEKKPRCYFGDATWKRYAYDFVQGVACYNSVYINNYGYWNKKQEDTGVGAFKPENGFAVAGDAQGRQPFMSMSNAADLADDWSQHTSKLSESSVMKNPYSRISREKRDDVEGGGGSGRLVWEIAMDVIR